MGTSGSGTEYYHQGGSYYLEVDSECSWQVTARTASAGENGGAGLSASGSGSHSTQTELPSGLVEIAVEGPLKAETKAV
jgi:hypothetical protein